VGNLGFKNIDRRHGRAEFWIYVGESAAAGRGIGTEAVKTALEIGFEQLALSKIYLHVDPANTAALRIYEKNGFRTEGLLQEELALGGSRRDVARLALLEPSWRTSRRRGPKVALMQPQFLPWLGYLELVQRANIFVFLDDFQFVRRSWGHRNRLFVVRGQVGMVTVPVRHDAQESTFLDVAEAETCLWRRKLLTLLEQNYGSAPYGEQVLGIAREWLSERYASLADLEIALIRRIADYLQLRTRFMRSSSLGVQGLHRSERLRALLEAAGAGTYLSAQGSFGYMKEDGVFPLDASPAYFQNHVPRPYRQHSSPEFVPHLSCLDALANLHPSDVRTIIAATEWWHNWEERAATGELRSPGPPALPS
jgi:hypothetical protein